MPIDPFAVLNALLRAEAARSSEHEPKTPTKTSTTSTAPTAQTPAAAPGTTDTARKADTHRDADDTL